ncbi:alpha-L-fucosidase [uncultured Porphyromonas sp.]|uniref:alpha-L-fucosidase n=1 Tax=uncultured Porphyromonas sp. TaxID=159274 RepID=UPI00260F15C4|nr:alpha-L-fucosidase [uncultured Porphyromonas sp.]
MMTATKRILLLLLLMTTLPPLSGATDWSGDKFSLFIHYGLYSTYGGVYDGVPVTDGYSEQIFSFGVHYMDVYEASARDFTASDFDADSIAALAKKAGMRSVVLTAKHHEGFCLWDTATTDFSAARAPRCGRDLVGEMAEACHRAGLRFGLYFSLIDWHFPGAVPYSSHNADPVTPGHHEYNKRQVRELLTKYGSVDELWFDMGSLTPGQSHELYRLVKSLQPDCMVSGRLGNDCADFAVFPDNETPDYTLDIPWQTAASFFPETWGYRSWQRRGSVETKVREKLSDLLRVVCGGGKYLLNIGPDGEGGVVPFERQVLEGMGRWLSTYGAAIYGTEGLPCHNRLMTRRADGRELYLFVPDDRTLVELPALTASPLSAVALDDKGGVELTSVDGHPVVRCVPLAGVPCRAIRLSFADPVSLQSRSETIYAYSLADYYSGLRSVVGYRVVGKGLREISFPREYEGREVEVNGDLLTLKGQPYETKSPTVRLVGPLSCRLVGGQLGRMPSDNSVVPQPVEGAILRDTLLGSPDQHRGLLLEQELACDQSGDLRVDLSYSGGFLLYLDDQYIDGGFVREGEERIPLLLSLTPGRHRLRLKLYNGFGPRPYALLTPIDRYEMQRMTLPVTDEVTITRPHRFPVASPAHLSALRLR